MEMQNQTSVRLRVTRAIKASFQIVSILHFLDKIMYIYLRSSSKRTDAVVPLLTSLHVMVAVRISGDTTMWSWDSVTRPPSIMVSSTNVSGFIILVILVPTTSVEVSSSWRPLRPMYSLFLHAVTNDLFVVQVKSTSCPGQA